MDPALTEAATNGDVNFLTCAASQQPPEYFLMQSQREGIWGYLTYFFPKNFGNIFHLAAQNGQVEFFREAMRILPKQVVKSLLSQKDEDGWTPLHVAADLKMGKISHDIVKLIINSHKSLLFDDDINGEVVIEKPWLALTTNDKRTPLHIALSKSNKENDVCGMDILLMDVELLSGMADGSGFYPLYLAMLNGLSQVAETILMYNHSSSFYVIDINWLTPLHLAPNCSEKVLKLLLKKCGECIDKIDSQGFTVLHQWVQIGQAWPCNLILNSEEFPEVRRKLFKDLVCLRNNVLDTPLHIAVKNMASELGQILVRAYQQEVRLMEGGNQEQVTGECPPWKMQDIDGNTPLHIALYMNTTDEELALQLLSVDPTLCQILNNKGESPFMLAVLAGCERVVEEIFRIEEPRFHMLKRHDGFTVLHSLSESKCSEKTCRRLLEKYWWMISLTNDSRHTALDYAKQAKIPWLVDLLMDPSLIRKEHFDWIAACERNETEAVQAFLDNCNDLQRVCREQNDTPLHHIRLPTYKQYLNFLRIPSIAELKNTTDYDGSTPLHRALERKDIFLSKILLMDDRVERRIEDNYGTTAMDLLAKLCRENDDWEKMRKQIKVNPYLKTSYIRPGTNLDQMRNTLSVVAALLATITFAAGFTLPGGINSDTGEAILAKRPSFLVFLLADVYAMCTSMLVLFCLMWSMVIEPDMSRLLVDRSVFILMQSLYSTLLAFMTGIFTVISHSSLWAAILIFVMCSIIGISANRTILHNVIAKLVPAASEKKDRMRMLEEGSAGESATGEDASREAVRKRRWVDYRWLRKQRGGVPACRAVLRAGTSGLGRVGARTGHDGRGSRAVPVPCLG